MAKLSVASEDVEKIFDEVLEKTSIPSWVEFRVLCNNKQKKSVCKLVKSGDVTEILSEGVNFAMIINEKVFEQLPEDMQKIVIEEELTGVIVSETDTVSFEKPDFTTYSGIIQKYGNSEVLKLKESVKSIYVKIKEEEDETKAITRKSKKNK